MKTAIIQLAVNDNENYKQRLIKVEKKLAIINNKTDKPDLILLPELWGVGFFNFDQYREENEPVDGNTFIKLAPWAKRIGCYLLTGSFIEREGYSYYNSTLLITPQGKIAGKYRKIHLFSYESRENEILTSGENPCLVDTKFGVCGITTCYDLRFPELYRQMVDKSAEIFLITAAWPRIRLKHWLLFNQVRALENLCYLISCNCAGSLKGNIFGGHSMIVAPNGEIIAEAGEQEEIIWADLDLHRIEEVRENFPALRDRRKK